jgi:hypothetical protein
MITILVEEFGRRREYARYDELTISDANEFLDLAAQLWCDQQEDAEYVVSANNTHDGIRYYIRRVVNQNKTTIAKFWLEFS